MSNEETRLAAMAAHRRCSKHWSDLPTISATDLATLPEGTAIVDVRTKEELDVSRIPNSVTVAELEAARRSGTEPPAVVSVCTVGFRAGLWAQALRLDYSGPIFVSQGILLHALDGYPVVRQEAANEDDASGAWVDVKEIHTFDKSHAFVPNGWTAKYYSALNSLRHAAPFVPLYFRFSGSAKR